MNSKQLQKWRSVMGYTTKQASEALGVTPNAYRALEAGKADISKRTALACAALYLGAEKIAQPWLGH